MRCHTETHFVSKLVLFVSYACLVHTAFSQCLLIYSLTWELRALYSLLFIGFLFECKMVLSSVFLAFFDWPWLACSYNFLLSNGSLVPTLFRLDTNTTTDYYSLQDKDRFDWLFRWLGIWISSQVLQRLGMVIGTIHSELCQNRHGSIMYRPYQGLIQGWANSE